MTFEPTNCPPRATEQSWGKGMKYRIGHCKRCSSTFLVESSLDRFTEDGPELESDIWEDLSGYSTESGGLSQCCDKLVAIVVEELIELKEPEDEKVDRFVLFIP